MDQILHPTFQHAERLEEHPAIIAGGSVVTYRQLGQRVRGTLRSLNRFGVRVGDRVVLAGANSPDWVTLAHAIPRSGAILAPLDPQLCSEGTARYLQRLAPSLILVDDAAGNGFPWSEWSSCPVASIADAIGIDESAGNTSANETTSAAGLHSIIPTSGTGGAPKGVCLTMRNHVASALASALNLGIHPHDRWLADLPFHHIGGLAIILRAGLSGTTVVLPDPREETTVWETIIRRRVTQLSLVATTLARLVDQGGDQPGTHHLRTILVGGGPTRVELLRKARSLGLPVLPTYGMTETASQVATLSPGASDAKLHTTGYPLAMCDVEIRDDDGQPLPPGTDGTICVRGPMLSPGYWIAPDHIEPIANDGWFVTNDLGRFDDDGYLVPRGRRDNVIITGGKKVSAEEVEVALEQMEGIKRAAAFGLDDREWGQKIVALIEMAPGAACDPDSMRAQLRTHLPTFKIPKLFVPADQIPLTATGKIDRRRLAAFYETTTDRPNA